MLRGPLADRLEYAILAIVFQNPANADQQHHWGDWESAVRKQVPDPFVPADLLSAFRRLRESGVVRLTKPDGTRRHAHDYSGKDSEDESFFFKDPFNAAVTDKGRAHWDRLRLKSRSQIFISHITQEKPVALVIQKYLKLAFGHTFQVFVSSDAKSISGGKKWYNYILENLRLSEVVLVLVSQESRAREWINFEAGFGEGSESLVIPVALSTFSLGQLSLPLSGLQGRSVDDLAALLDDIGNRVGVPAAEVDARAYLSEMRDAEAQVVYKSLKVEPVVQGNSLMFDIENVGGVDLELLMLDVYIPSSVGLPSFLVGSGVDVAGASRAGIAYKRCSCYSGRGTYRNLVPLLRPIITPSMGKVRPLDFALPVRRGLSADEMQLSIFFQIHASGYRTEEEERKIADLQWD